MRLGMVVAAFAAVTLLTPVAQAAGHQTCTIAWSHYTGWEPIDYMKSSGILKKWGDKYGVDFDITPPMDYVESMNQYTAKQFCAVAVTNMDALTIPAASGVDSTFVVIGDYSDGNDGILIKSGKPASLKDLVGKQAALVENTVSHYLLLRALEMSGVPQDQVKTVNTSDADIGNVFATGGDQTIVVTWNPILMTARNVKGAQLLFDSSKIPGEIIDGLVVHTDTPDNVKKALVGAWYETAQVMAESGTPANREAIRVMAQSAGGSEGEFLAQLKTTHMFYRPADAVAFAGNSQLKATMNSVRKFAFDLKLLGDAESPDHIGIQFPDGEVSGNQKNVKLRFDTSFIKMAADGKL
ncbi:ABC transporter substrate-binding protein [Candidatus Kaiserbacteria bacterium]|nr:ABC transporter substrate-binding protein [Candidatus Kaiserbacteria bacterium]